MGFKDPVLVYTAASNLEAHSLVEALIASGIDAYAVEDQSGASLWALGTSASFTSRTFSWINPTCNGLQN